MITLIKTPYFRSVSLSRSSVALVSALPPHFRNILPANIMHVLFKMSIFFSVFAKLAPN